ncbi:hypothetical protein CTAYLR_000862 [Chrysophaeum taylorii]|uniref:Rhodanese domain-containing protein n=1 Tax=Chrysophaeum taylorii TaxID=2483200 RepID=A0AAD7UPC1_9STRA|nr:hypothetical protein CTAYLR_000862 [Chrysophaeum taylorii]
MLSRGEAVLLDVREPDEWKGGHFARAKLVPYTSQLEKGVVPDDVKQVTKRIFIHCKAGGRASKSCDVLKNQFGLDAVSIPEGFDKLRELGFDDVVV